MTFQPQHDFKPLRISDQDVINAFTRRFRPYSDFNFTSLISWDTNDTVEYAIYQDCLIIKFPDYITQVTCYSILGLPTKSKKTVDELVTLLNKTDTEFEFAFLPEISTKRMHAKYRIDEDIDQHDYIYSAKKQADLEGHEFAWQRRRLSQFNKVTAEAEVEIRKIQPHRIESELFGVWPSWEKASENIPNSRYEYEKIAIKRYAQLAEQLRDQRILGLYINNQLEGVTMCEATGRNLEYLICHFMKVNYKYQGIFNRMFYELSKFGANHNYKYINFEQDLGIDGLRIFKRYLKPSFHLKKFRLSTKTQPKELERE